MNGRRRSRTLRSAPISRNVICTVLCRAGISTERSSVTPSSSQRQLGSPIDNVNPANLPASRILAMLPSARSISPSRSFSSTTRPSGAGKAAIRNP